VDQIVNNAAGNFLYAEFVLDELESGKRTFRELNNLPHALYALYREYLSRLLPELQQTGSSSRWTEQFQPLLGRLSVATPAAPEKILPRWLEQPAGDVHGRINAIIQITEGYPIEGENGFALFHRSVADFLAAQRYEENRESFRNFYFTPPQEQHVHIAG